MLAVFYIMQKQQSKWILYDKVMKLIQFRVKI